MKTLTMILLISGCWIFDRLELIKQLNKQHELIQVQRQTIDLYERADSLSNIYDPAKEVRRKLNKPTFYTEQ
jgi:hypothetical protein